MPKIAYIIFGIISVVFIFLLIVTVSYNSTINKPLGKDLSFEIPLGTGRNQFVQSISKELGFGSIQQNYLKLYIYNNKNLPFEAGVYSFDSSKTVKYMFENLKGGSKQVSVTFLEGWRVEENALELKEKVGSGYSKEYFEAAKNMQGKLFPDTYYIDPAKSALELVQNQQDNFDNKTSPLFKSYSGSLSTDEVIKIASIVQRESLPNDDIQVIAGILIKRYQNDLPLDADATTQYVVGSRNNFNTCFYDNNSSCEDLVFWPNNLTTADLESKDPYNTRGQLGLPPKPISNPSFESIKAVLNPKETTYFYYLHDLSGKTYFAETLDEHIENIQKYL